MSKTHRKLLPEEGFDNFVHNLNRQQVQVECNDFDMTTYFGELIGRKFSVEEKMPYLIIKENNGNLVEIWSVEIKSICTNIFF